MADTLPLLLSGGHREWAQEEGDVAWSLRTLASAIFSQAMEVETVTSHSYLNDTAGSQAAEVHTLVSGNSSEKIVPPLHTLT